MRSILALAASAMAALAGVIASLDHDTDIVPFFIGLAFLGGVQAWAAHSPFGGQRRTLARGVALLWLVASIWIGALLVMYQVACGCSSPPPAPVDSYLGLPATAYHLLGLYGGVGLVLASAFGPDHWFQREAQTQT